MKYSYTPLRSFPRDCRPALTLLHPDFFFFISVQLPNMHTQPSHDCENSIEVEKEHKYIFLSHACGELMCSLIQTELLLMHGHLRVYVIHTVKRT